MLASIGHNNPPTETEVMHSRLNAYKDDLASLARLKEREIPAKIEDDVSASRLSDFLKSAKELAKRFDTIHKAEKAPFWEACKAADNWRNEKSSEISEIIAKASAPILAWNKAKEEAERQRQLELARKAREEADRLAAEAAAHAEAGIQDTAEELLNMAVNSEGLANAIQENQVDLRGTTRGSFSSTTTRKVWEGRIVSAAALDLEVLRKYFSHDELQSALNRAVRDGVRELRGAEISQQDKLTTR